MASYYRPLGVPKLPSLPSTYKPPPTAGQLQNAYDAFHPPGLPNVQGSYPTPDLSPEDVNYFSSASRRADLAKAQGFAQSELGNAQGLQSHNLALQALQQRFDEVRRRLPGQYISRGVGQSGIAAQGLLDYNRDRTQANFGENLRYQQQVGQSALNAAQMEQVWKSTIADLEAQKQARRQTILASYNQQVK